MYVLSPEHTGSAPTAGPVGVIGSPHELLTVGGVGTACASIIQATLEEPLAGKVKVGGDTVYVYTQGLEDPSQFVYVQVYVLSPEQTGSAPMTGPVTVSGSPQELVTFGGVGTVWASIMHATVDEPSAGSENEDGSTV